MVRNSSLYLPQLLRQVDRHIDGNDYMWALSEMLDSAKEFIFILVCILVWFLWTCSNLLSGLVAHARALLASTACFPPRMEVGPHFAKES